MKIKRFVVFKMEQYYPGGGFNDYDSSWDTKEEAEAQIAKLMAGPRKDWQFTELVDLENFISENSYE